MGKIQEKIKKTLHFHDITMCSCKCELNFETQTQDQP